MLDGGLPAWRAAGGEVDTSPVDEAALHAPAQALRSPPGATKCAAADVLGGCCGLLLGVQGERSTAGVVAALTSSSYAHHLHTSPYTCACRYQARLDKSAVRDWQQMLANSSSGGEQVVDARPAPR